MSTPLTDIVRPFVQEAKLTALTGGGTTSLDGITTVGLAVSPVPLRQFVIADIFYLYELSAGTDAESSPTIIRPDDYAGGTNQKVWRLLFTTLYDRFGSGSPETVVSAPVGTVYHRTDGGAATSLYVKESGSGNTGWIAK